MAKLRTTIINKFGTMQGWNSLTVNMLFRDMEGITKLAYDDTEGMENVKGAGGYPVGRTEEDYEATCSMEVYKEEMDALQQSLPPGARVQKIPAFDIVAEYERNDGTIQKDIIRNVQIRGQGRSITQGDGTIVVPLNLICSHIDWNV